MHEDDEDTKPVPTVLQDAERLIGRMPAMDSKTDAQLKRIVVRELLDIADLDAKSDSFIEGAFRVLATSDARVPQSRRQMRLDAARNTELQVRRLRDARPAGYA